MFVTQMHDVMFMRILKKICSVVGLVVLVLPVTSNATLKMTTHAPFHLNESAYTIDMAHKKGLITLAQLIQLTGGVMREESWGVMAKASPECSNIGFNFVLLTTPVHINDLDVIEKTADAFFKNTPYQLWIDDYNQSLCHDLHKKKFHEKIYPAKYIEFTHKMPVYQIVPDLMIVQAKNKQHGQDWAKVTAQVYKLDKDKLFAFFKKASDLDHVRFHVGYVKGEPVSTRMTLVYGDTATGCFSATLPEYRKKGIASSLMRYTFQELHNDGVSLFVNKASAGRSAIWRKAGLKEYGNNYRCFVRDDVV